MKKIDQDMIDDYIIIKTTTGTKPTGRLSIKCSICGHVKDISLSNSKMQSLKHSARNCKMDFYRQDIGKIIDDYTVIDVFYDNSRTLSSNSIWTKLKCNICDSLRVAPSSTLKNTPFNHNASSCSHNYYKDEVGNVHGDYKIISFSYSSIPYYYYNVECLKCKTKGVKSLRALKNYNFSHGKECFKMLQGDYKKEIQIRYHNIVQRCTNINSTKYPFYGGRGIKVDYHHCVDFYLDFIDEFKNHANIHGINNTTFDRIDVNGDYSKNNIRVATREVQAVNTRRSLYFIVKKENDVVLCNNTVLFGKTYGVPPNAIGNLTRKLSKTSFGWTLIASATNIDDLKNINVTTKLIAQ